MSAPNRQLERDLWRQVDRLANTVTLTRGTAPASGPHKADQQRKQIAAAWVYLSAVAAWAEDHQLTQPLLRDTALVGQMTDASGCLWLMRAMAALTVHPATRWLMHRDYNPGLWAGTPSATGCAELVRWWCKDAPSLAADDPAGPLSAARIEPSWRVTGRVRRLMRFGLVVVAEPPAVGRVFAEPTDDGKTLLAAHGLPVREEAPAC